MINVEIDEEGQVVKRMPKIDREGQLINTLLHRLYPEIKVARVSVPTFSLDEVETEKVKDALSSFTLDGIEYHLDSRRIFYQETGSGFIISDGWSLGGSTISAFYSVSLWNDASSAAAYADGQVGFDSGNKRRRG